MVRWKPVTAAIALFLGCFAVFPMAIVGWGFTHLPGDLVDGRFNNVVLEHGYRSLVLGQGEFWNAPFCYPARGVTACSDSHLGNLPIYAAFRACGAGPERSFQLWWLSTFALTYAAGIAGARMMGLRAFGACLASAAFTFSPLIAANSGHAQLFPRYFLPLSVGFYWWFLKDAKAKHLFAAVLAWVGQMSCSFYLGYFLAWFLGALTLASLLTRAVPWKPLVLPKWYEWGKRAAAVSFALILLWPTVKPYVFPDHEKVPPNAWIAIRHLPQVIDWVTPHPCSALWGWLGKFWLHYIPYCKHAFFGGIGLVGLVVGAAALYGWMRRRRPECRVPAAWALATFSLGLFFTGFYDSSLYELALELPMVASMRATFRIALILSWPLALLCGRWVDQWRERRPDRRFGIALFFAVFVVTDVRVDREHCGGCSIREAVDRKTRLAEELRKHPEMKSFYLFPGALTPSVFDALAHHVDAIAAGQVVGVPTVNGWTGNWPAGWGSFESYTQVLGWMDRFPPEFQDGLLFFGTPTFPETDPRAEALRKRRPPIPFDD